MQDLGARHAVRSGKLGVHAVLASCAPDIAGPTCRGHKVVIFVLDEFDLFARKPKQTLLYNLLDAMQASDMQV